MRFRARFPADGTPPVPVLDGRVVVPAETIREEWDNGTGGGRSLVPRPVRAYQPRVGRLLRTVEPRPQDGRDWWDLTFEDVDPVEAPIGRVLTIIGTLPPDDVRAVARLLEHIVSQPLPTVPRQAAAARAVTPWLRGRFPVLARAADRLPAVDPALWDTFLDGVALAAGDTVPVPTAPLHFTYEPPPVGLDAMSGHLTVRGDVVDRLRHHGRSN